MSVANLAPTGPGGLADVLSKAFGGSLTASSTTGSAAAVAAGLAIAIASAIPCECRIQPSRFGADG